MTTSPQDVVILAAGNGLRLSSLSPVPKPLVTVGGRPLLDRLLLTLLEAELSRACIVVGHAGTAVRHYPFAAVPQLHVQWVDNPEFRRPNGLSLLCAEGVVRPPFLLLMADHLFEVATLQRFLEQPCPADGAVVAVDRKLDAVYDLSDATKVLSKRSTLHAIGKHLRDYDSIDTGMFLCSGAAFNSMRDSAARGRESLSEGIATLSRLGSVRTWDIGPARWIDVDTPEAHEEAERMIQAGCFRLT
jgi:choline kinase